MTSTAPPATSLLAAEPPPTARNAPFAVTVLAASLPVFMATLDNLVMTTALPVVQADLDASVTELSWFLNAYTLTFAAFMLTAATVGDRWGRRRTMIAGLLVFGAASIAAALSTSSESLIVARAVQGLGAAAMMPLSLTLLAASVPAAKRAMAIGIWGGVSGLGVALGPVVGGAVGTLVLATALIPAYVVWARSRPDAVLPLHLFASRGFSVANVIGPTFTLEMFGAVFLLSQYLQVVQGYSPLEAGLRTLPWTAAPMLVAPLAGAVAHRTGLRSLLVAGLSLQAGALVWFAWLTENAEPYSAFAVPLALAGIGMGLTFAPSATAVLDGLPEVDFAVASSANSTIREFGVAMGIAVLTAVFLGNGGTITPSGYDGAIGPALLTGAAAVLVALVAALAAPGRNAR